MSDTSVVIEKETVLNCKLCGAPPSTQMFGPTIYIQGTIKIWICSNHEKLKGNCSSDVAYMSLKDWNEGNEGASVVKEPVQEVNLPAIFSSPGNNSVSDIIKYQATCKQELMKAGLWNSDLDALRLKAFEGVETLVTGSTNEIISLPKVDVVYDSSDDSVAVMYDDGRCIYAMPDASITVGQVADGKDSSDRPFVKYDFDELMTRTFEFGDLSVSCKVDIHPYRSEVTHTLADGTTVLLKSNGDLIIKEPDDDYSLETTVDKLLQTPETLQMRKDKWMRTCFTDDITDDPKERNRRFLEESLEVVQSLNMDRHEAHFMVDYVFDRTKGESFQEVGGAILTLAALCNANKINLMEAAEAELARVWTKVDVIRGKQKQKPNFLDDLDWIVEGASQETLQSYAHANIEELAKARFMKSADMSLRYADPLAGLNLAMALKQKAQLIILNDKGYIEPFKD